MVRNSPRSRFLALWLVPAAIVLLLAVVLLAKWLRDLPGVQEFMTVYPGATAPDAAAPVGFPPWLGWQHFFNAFLIVLIIRSGWMVRTTQRPSTYWTRHNGGKLRTKGVPKRISLDLWLHLSLDVLWVINGLIFVVLLFVTGQWMRVVPLGWDVLPNAVSVGIQYLSLDWPHESGWIHYNALQLISYFLVIFIASPLAIVSGIRMSPAWSARLKRFSRIYPMEVARAIHLPVMLFFVAFIVVHVTLVLATGALRNLNHMYAGRDDDGWLGFIIFAISLAAMVGAWLAARPVLLRPIAARMGKVSR